MARTVFCISEICGGRIDLESSDNDIVKIPGKGYCCSMRCELSYRDQQEPWREFKETNFFLVLDGGKAPWETVQKRNLNQR